MTTRQRSRHARFAIGLAAVLLAVAGLGSITGAFGRSSGTPRAGGPTSGRGTAPPAAARLSPGQIDAAMKEAEGGQRTSAGNTTWFVGEVGTYMVGRGIPPGTYVSAAPGNGTCSWSRLRSPDAVHGVITQATTRTASTITILKTDRFFTTTGCTNWHRVG